jgi:hypothetical protein
MPSRGRVERRGVEDQGWAVRKHHEQEMMDEYDLVYLEAKPSVYG